MGLTYTIDEGRNLIVIAGDYTDEREWETVLTQLLTDTRRRPGCRVLRDQRGGTRPVDASTVVKVMDVVQRLWDTLAVQRAAIVMPRELDPPGLVVQAIADERHMPIQVFTSYDAALEWLMNLRGP